MTAHFFAPFGGTGTRGLPLQVPFAELVCDRDMPEIIQRKYQNLRKIQDILGHAEMLPP